jgi:hypothetical protein
MKALEAARKRARAAARDGKARESAKGLRRVTIEVRPGASVAAAPGDCLGRAPFALLCSFALL